MSVFRDLVSRKTGLDLSDYRKLHQWSVDHFEDFWSEWLSESKIIFEGSASPAYMEGSSFRTGTWFPEIRLNFAENLLSNLHQAPIVSILENGECIEISRKELKDRVAHLQKWLTTNGIGPGDRVAAVVTHSWQAVVGMLATTSIGAVWTSTSPDFGLQGILDRLQQVEPKILLAVDGYNYNGKAFDLKARNLDLLGKLPTVKAFLEIGFLNNTQCEFEKITSHGPAPELHFEKFPFHHPLYILYSSGTTGQPKCIVHGTGGTLLQHSKELKLHCDLGPQDRILYFTTCGWMMWNWVVSSLSTGAQLVTFDGSPSHPTLDRLWNEVSRNGVTVFGTSAKFLASCRMGGLEAVSKKHDLSKLRMVLSTGSPLAPEDFDWVSEQVSPSIRLCSISGGTDIVSCFVLGTPMKSVRRGMIQDAGLGMDVAAFDSKGLALIGEKGELVCRKPFVAMPVKFWNDTDSSKYEKAYFSHFPNTWFHGDYITIFESGDVVIHGRSDATLNPGGVRIGTSEIYRIVEGMGESLGGIQDSLAIGYVSGSTKDLDEKIVLFVKFKDASARLTPDLEKLIRTELRTKASPRHVPHVILACPDIPYTRSGKKVEIAVKQILAKKDPDNLEALSNPESLKFYKTLQGQLT